VYGWCGACATSNRKCTGTQEMLCKLHLPMHDHNPSMKIDSNMLGLCDLMRFQKNLIVACMPLDDSIHATGTPIHFDFKIKLNK
jgi:hypothetical protein